MFSFDGFSSAMYIIIFIVHWDKNELFTVSKICCPEALSINFSKYIM